MRCWQELLNVDEALRFILFGLECALNVEFVPGEVERLFDDAEQDSAPVHYTFYQAQVLAVTGKVEDYEPGTIWLSVESRATLAPSLAEIVERAKYQFYRLEQWRNFSIRKMAEPERNP